ncbi:hypothetical protein MUP77_08120 [Candidatus Bathyarchaeota archaeon]|nr:hypothetical protein [Candidatus Bathyarchaeota archaeon]
MLVEIVLTVIASIFLSMVSLKILRDAVQIPFPSECVFGNPDEVGVERSLSLVENNTNLKWVMGTLNSQIFNDTNVRDCVRKYLARGIPTEIITGPQTKIDQESRDLYEEFVEAPSVKVYEMDDNPERHFKVISGKHLFIEPNLHKRGKSAYILLEKAKYWCKRYATIFESYKSQAKLVEKPIWVS